MELQLPFKPFTLQEVAKLTGASSRLIDVWADRVLPVRQGADGTLGLEYMQAFAVFVGHRWLQEGAVPEKATPVVRFIGSITPNLLWQEIDAGTTWPVPREGNESVFKGASGLVRGTFVKPPAGPLGQRLNLELLYTEFRNNLKTMFPESPA